MKTCIKYCIEQITINDFDDSSGLKEFREITVEIEKTRPTEEDIINNIPEGYTIKDISYVVLGLFLGVVDRTTFSIHWNVNL